MSLVTEIVVGFFASMIFKIILQLKTVNKCAKILLLVTGLVAIKVSFFLVISTDRFKAKFNIKKVVVSIRILDFRIIPR